MWLSEIIKNAYHNHKIHAIQERKVIDQLREKLTTMSDGTHKSDDILEVARLLEDWNCEASTARIRHKNWPEQHKQDDSFGGQKIAGTKLV